MYKTAMRTCPMNCIVNPDVWENIISNSAGDTRGKLRRQQALQTLRVTNTLRNARTATVERLRGARRRRQLRRMALMQRIQGLAETGIMDADIYDAHNFYKLPGDLERSETGPATGDAAVDEAFDGLKATYDLYWGEYGRDSIDDEGMTMKASVHFGQDYDNAFWDGRIMVFGDGDEELFNRFTISIDITGHELTHGVIEHEANLAYWSQSGSLNESCADVFGSLVKQYKAREKAEDADWLIGEGLFTANVNGVALRSLKSPGTAYDDPVLGEDNQPAHMRDYFYTFTDNGGVHTNSGIPNHAFYLAATRIGEYAWERAGLIWYDTLTNPYLRPTANFQSFARLTVLAAQRLYGGNSAEVKAVSSAWSDVGVFT